MLHCSASRQTPTRTVFSRLCPSPLVLTSPPFDILTCQATRRPTSSRRYHPTDTSVSRDLPGSPPAYIPHVRNHAQDHPTDPSSKIEPYTQAHLEREVRWLKDPLKMANHTAELLQEGKVQKAFDIVKLGSKFYDCTVSWNHLIDYEMSVGRVIHAIKLFYEMKRRAQQPDAYTFTLLLRGLSRSSLPKYSLTTSRALAIYHAMFAHNSPVKPSIIHTNAVLKVFAKALDIDTLLRIAAELPTRGKGAPDKVTFTTILNAMRRNTPPLEEKRVSAGEEDAVGNRARALAVQQGRRLWVDIRERWMSGDLLLDEDFVCAFGRLLLLGNDAQDHDDVLSLLEQTMGIPRQVARVANSALGKADGGEASKSNDDLDPPPRSPKDVELENPLSTSEEKDEFIESPSESFAPLHSAAGPSQSAVRPGRSTLSLVIDVCVLLGYPRAARDYWGLLTSPDGYYKVMPDSDNYHMYLRLLRIGRCSRLAAELVDEMRSGDLIDKAGVVQARTFRIALSCCVRDIKNRNSISYAGRLVKIMLDALPYPDAKALIMYLRVALGHEPRDWRVILRAVRDVELGLGNLRSLLAYDPDGPKKQNEQDIMDLVRSLVRAFDVVLDLGNEEIARAEKKRCREQRHALAAYVTRNQNRLVAEGKAVPGRNGQDGGSGAKGAPSDGRRQGRGSDGRRQTDGKDEDDGFGR